MPIFGLKMIGERMWVTFDWSSDKLFLKSFVMIVFQNPTKQLPTFIHNVWVAVFNFLSALMTFN